MAATFVVGIRLSNTLRRLWPAEAYTALSDVVRDDIVAAVARLLQAPLREAALRVVGDVEPRADEGREAWHVLPWNDPKVV